MDQPHDHGILVEEDAIYFVARFHDGYPLVTLVDLDVIMKRRDTAGEKPTGLLFAVFNDLDIQWF